MRATKAYIASLGTTGLLLAFSASLLVVVGALFAFDAWPGADIRDAVDNLVVNNDQKPYRVAGPAQVALDAAPAAVAVASAPFGGSTPGGGVPGVTISGPGAGGPPPGNTPSGGLGGGDEPVAGTGPGISTLPARRAPIDTGGQTNQLADTTEQATRDLGNAVGGVNPDLGNAVSETGQALSDIVRDLPDVQAGPGGVSVGGRKVGGGR